MKKIVFNDSRQLDIQKAEIIKEGILHIRMILTDAETLKALFGDSFATERMVYYENQQQTAVYENYTDFRYVKEETGGIWEVEMMQPEKDAAAKIEELTAELAETKEELAAAKIQLEAANGQITDLQMALCEIYEGTEV